MYAGFIGRNVLYMSLHSIWSKLWFNSNMSFLIFCLDDLSIAKSEMLKTLTFL